MGRLFLVQNELPVRVREIDGGIHFDSRLDAVSGSLRGFAAQQTLIVGTVDLCTGAKRCGDCDAVDQHLQAAGYVPVCVAPELFDRHQEGFCRRTLWPLFHYFTETADFKQDYFAAYRQVNEQFAERLAELVQPEDTVWIHDYQLLLLPALLRQRVPGISIGFFLHIPFPSFEVFRLLPQRREILNGMLGADLVAFHTFDYQRHFLSALRRLLGLETEYNRILLEDRTLKVDAYPMGIDFERFDRPAGGRETAADQWEQGVLADPAHKVILSVDRLDYTKGIRRRLRAYEQYLLAHPEQQGRVTFFMITAPTAFAQDSCVQDLQHEVNALVGGLNGRLGDLNWHPVWYLATAVTEAQLVALYQRADVMVVTPMRDGMNLIAKEYIAACADDLGVLILSELTGAASELSEALIVNPNDVLELAQVMERALEMPPAEQQRRNKILRERLRRYGLRRWAADLQDGLREVKDWQRRNVARHLSGEVRDRLWDAFKRAESRVFFLDYDGTLVDFKRNPERAVPDEELRGILADLAAEPKNTVVVVSGRDRPALEAWFSDLPLTLIAEHGAWVRSADKEWVAGEAAHSTDAWKDVVRELLESFVDRTPGTFIEEKSFSLAWHYRKADPDMGQQRAWELRDALRTLISDHKVEILDGSYVVEVKASGNNKGKSALAFLAQAPADFVLGIGDDRTDEYLFEALPPEAFTIKVGLIKTKAAYYVDSVADVRSLLRDLG